MTPDDAGRPSDPPTAPAPDGAGDQDGAGRLVNRRYRLLRSLGRGGMGVVWEARDEMLDREVAVKEVTLPPGLDESQRTQMRERTLREARAAARIRSDAAVTVYDVVEEDGRPWIVMELLPARSLAEVVREEGPLTAEQAARTGLRLLDALAAAHAAGVLHRDVKPANVLYDTTGRAVLTDFGIASLEGDPSMTTTGTVVGSPGYVAPERATGRPPSPASDLWSLGVTLAAAVHGRSPFERDTPLATIVAAMQDPLPEGVVTGPLGPVIDRLLDKDPARRPDIETARRLLEEAASGAAALGATSVLPPVAPDPFPASGPRAPGSGAADAELTQALPRVPRRPAWTGPTPPRPSAGVPVAAGGRREPRPRPVPPAEPALRRSRLLPVLLAVVAVVAAVMVAVVVLERRDDAAAASGDPTTSATTDAATTGPAPDAGTAPAPEQAPPAAEPPPASEPAASEPAAEDGADDGADDGAEDGAEDSADDGADDGADEGAAPPAAPADGAPGEAPEGFRLYEDPAFRVAVPEGWTAEADGENRTVFQDPASRRYLLVEEGGEPAGDPVEDWEDQEASVSQSGRFPGYELLGIERADFRGFSAADWQFRWDAEGGRLRVLNRAVVDPELNQAYALYWSVPDQEWDAARPVFQTVASSFQPLG